MVLSSSVLTETGTSLRRFAAIGEPAPRQLQKSWKYLALVRKIVSFKASIPATTTQHSPSQSNPNNGCPDASTYKVTALGLFFCYDIQMSTIYTAFKDKVIIVVGGASGIGEHLVRQLSSFGKTVIILDRNKKAGTTLAKKLTTRVTGEVIFEAIEMSNTKSVHKLLHRLNTKYGPIDYFFNAAGIFMAGEMRDTPVENWHKVMDSNLQPIINGTTSIYEIMQKNGHGHIINFASAAGLFPVPIMSIYGATKHAIVGLTLGLRIEAKSLNIKASVVCPTVVNTPLYDTAIYNNVDLSKALRAFKNPKVQKPQVAAMRIISATAQNKAVIHTAISTYLAWVLYRISPSLYTTVSQRFITMYRKKGRKQ